MAPSNIRSRHLWTPQACGEHRSTEPAGKLGGRPTRQAGTIRTPHACCGHRSRAAALAAAAHCIAARCRRLALCTTQAAAARSKWGHSSARGDVLQATYGKMAANVRHCGCGRSRFRRPRGTHSASPPRRLARSPLFKCIRNTLSAALHAWLHCRRSAAGSQYATAPHGTARPHLTPIRGLRR